MNKKQAAFSACLEILYVSVFWSLKQNSEDNQGNKQFWSRSEPTFWGSWSESKLIFAEVISRTQKLQLAGMNIVKREEATKKDYRT